MNWTLTLTITPEMRAMGFYYLLGAITVVAAMWLYQHISTGEKGERDTSLERKLNLPAKYWHKL